MKNRILFLGGFTLKINPAPVMHKAGEEHTHTKNSYVFQFQYKRNVAAECLKVGRNASGLLRTQFEYHYLRPFFDRHEVQLLSVGVRF